MKIDELLIEFDKYACEWKKQLVAEIKRLKADNKALEMWNECYTEQFKSNNQVVKEFAEKLKEKAYTNNYCQEVILKSEIDELLKEYEK